MMGKESSFEGTIGNQEAAVAQSEAVLVDRIKKEIGDTPLRPDEIHEIVFSVLIADKILDGFERTLRECKFSDTESKEIKESLNMLFPKEILQALSIPWEIQKKRFEAFKAALDAGEMKPDDIVVDLLDSAKEHGFTVGFHISANDIMPETTRFSPEKTWMIKGYELDDRDDRPMAYYSLDYKDLYRKRKGRYLYLVRAQPIEGSGHKVDTSNRWGRASVLSVIDRIDLQKEDIDTKVHKIAEQVKRAERV